MANDSMLKHKAIEADQLSEGLSEDLSAGFTPADPEEDFSRLSQVTLSAKPIQHQWIDELYSRHASNLLGYLRKLVGSGPPDPQDVVHASFEKLASIDCPESIENPHAFLWRTAQNILSSEKRSASVRARHSVNVADVFYSDSGSGAGPERVLLAYKELSAVVAALECMPTQRRTVFLMSRVDGLSLTEIAKRLGISRPAVSKRLLLALKELRRAADRE